MKRLREWIGWDEGDKRNKGTNTKFTGNKILIFN